MNVIHTAAVHRGSAMATRKMIYPAADRNKDPILSVLKRFIRPGENQSCLEIASGTGQHVAHFAPHFPQVTFYPTECEADLLESIVGHAGGLANVREPVLVDVSRNFELWEKRFQEESFDYVYCANMIHVSPFSSTIGLFRNSGILLKDRGFLFTYGAYAIDGKIEPESNVRFNESIRAQNPEWGIRDVRDLQELARKHRIELVEIVDMPANNKTIVWQKKI